MNIPHQEPIKFVKEILKLDSRHAIISCEFPYYPTLAMICEAAAQSSIAFSQDFTKESQVGFLASLKDIEVVHELISTKYTIKVEKRTSIGFFSEYYFELLDSVTVISKGNFVIALKNVNS